MADLRFTLLSDGSSDKALIPILRWVLQAQNVNGAIQSEWADLRRLRDPPTALADKVLSSIELYPCDLLFIHRDAERDNRESRINEIGAALARVRRAVEQVPVVCVVPIRMHEAWLLFDEAAIRRAAGNPNGTDAIDLPRIRKVEGLPDPKAVLHELLYRASGLHGRRLKSFRVSKHAADVSSFINDFSPLRSLSAFRSLETDVRTVVRSNGWNSTHGD
jgi:hypothetical protein